MPDYRTKRPKILWGPGLANVLTIGYALDNVTRGPEPRAGHAVDQAPSGVEDAWDGGTDYLLTFDVGYIPREDTADPVATGWDGASGFAEFLTWVRNKNLMRFYPDKDGGTYIDSYLVEPMSGQGSPEQDGTTRVTMKIRNPATRYDGY